MNKENVVRIFLLYIISMMEYYSAIKKKEVLPFVTSMNLEGIMLSEISQTEMNMVPSS